MEFHAVILCGPGRNLSPFSKLRSSGSDKALLPVANEPMIENVLKWCEKAFFPKVTLICNEESKDSLQKAIDEYKVKRVEQDNKAKEINGDSSAYSSDISIIGGEYETSGSIILQLYKSSMIQPYEHFVILPCDFITNLPPQVLIEAYRNKSDSDVGLMVHYRNNLDIEDKKHKIFPITYSMYSELPDGQCQLLDIYSKEDIDFHKSLKVRTQMCWKYPNSVISTKLLNSSIFLGSSEVFEIFKQNPSKFTDSYFTNRSMTKVIRDLGRRSWRHSKPYETIGFLILPEKATFFRVNNTPVLIEANRYIIQQQATLKDGQNSLVPNKDKNSANVGIDSLVGANCTLGEKTNVKKTVIGKNCTIGKRAKLTGNLIMDNVTIEDDVQLENCIIGSGVVIHNKLKLINCNVESSHQVLSGSQFKGETLLSLSLEDLVENDGGNDIDESVLESESESGSESEDESDEESEIDEQEYGDNSDGLFDY